MLKSSQSDNMSVIIQSCSAALFLLLLAGAVLTLNHNILNHSILFVYWRFSQSAGHLSTSFNIWCNTFLYSSFFHNHNVRFWNINWWCVPPYGGRWKSAQSVSACEESLSDVHQRYFNLVLAQGYKFSIVGEGRTHYSVVMSNQASPLAFTSRAFVIH